MKPSSREPDGEQADADGDSIGQVVGAPSARTPKELAPMPTATRRPTRRKV